MGIISCHPYATLDSKKRSPTVGWGMGMQRIDQAHMMGWFITILNLRWLQTYTIGYKSHHNCKSATCICMRGYARGYIDSFNKTNGLLALVNAEKAQIQSSK